MFDKPFKKYIDGKRLELNRNKTKIMMCRKAGGRRKINKILIE